MTIASVKIKKLNPLAIVPAPTRPLDAGIDLRCLYDFTIRSGDRAVIGTGLAIVVPRGTYGQIAPRSGLAAEFGIQVLGGIIDSSYRGEWKVVLHNSGSEAWAAKAGDRIAQMLVIPVCSVTPIEVKELPESEDGRGADGFGSSGVS
jgi:dUTP pyrophosphatase